MFTGAVPALSGATRAPKHDLAGEVPDLFQPVEVEALGCSHGSKWLAPQSALSAKRRFGLNSAYFADYGLGSFHQSGDDRGPASVGLLGFDLASDLR